MPLIKNSGILPTPLELQKKDVNTTFREPLSSVLNQEEYYDEEEDLSEVFKVKGEATPNQSLI
jgi:hypothetical protein